MKHVACLAVPIAVAIVLAACEGSDQATVPEVATPKAAPIVSTPSPAPAAVAAPAPAAPEVPAAKTAAEPPAPEASAATMAAEPSAPVDVPAAYNAFGFRVHGEMRKADPGRNMFVSPISIAVALAMTYNGARGETKEAMAGVLGVSGMGLDAFNAANTVLAAALTQSSTHVTLRQANSLWARADMPFRQQFISRTRTAYDAGLENVNFLDPGTLERINGWVREKTEGKIDDLVKKDDLNDETLLILINAIYFKGDWKRAFDAAQTANRPFHAADGAAKETPMMRQRGQFAYAKAEGCQVVTLPYRDSALSMYVVLPDADSSLDALLATMTGDVWKAMAATVQPRQGLLVLPKFKAAYEIQLNSVLATMGMGIAFDRERADFADMADIRERICISKVRHKAYIEVNEKGTEAAAATSVGMARVTSVMPADPPFEMLCDRPFLYAICDTGSSTVLFMGTLEKIADL